MQGVQETLRIGFEAEVAWMQSLLEFFILLIERILTVPHQGIALQKEGMSCISHDLVVGVLSALRRDDARLQPVLLVPQLEVSTDVARIADLFQGQDIGPERVDVALIVSREQFSNL